MNKLFERRAELLEIQYPNLEEWDLEQLEQNTAKYVSELAQTICESFVTGTPEYGYLLIPSSSINKSDFDPEIKTFYKNEIDRHPSSFVAVYAERTKSNNYSAVHLATIYPRGQYISGMVVTATGMSHKDVAVHIGSHQPPNSSVRELDRWMNHQLNQTQNPQDECYAHVKMARKLLAFGYKQLAEKS